MKKIDKEKPKVCQLCGGEHDIYQCPIYLVIITSGS